MISKLLVYYELLNEYPIGRKLIEDYPGLKTDGFVERKLVKRGSMVVEEFPRTKKGDKLLESVLMKTIIEELQQYKENLEKQDL